MAGDIPITIIGNLTGDPELRFIPSGAAVANVTIASTPRTFDRQTNEWKDGETTFMNGSAWRQLAENMAESLQRGDRVIATGTLKSRSYTTKEGVNRTVMEMDISEIGPALSRGTARLTKVDRQPGGQQQQGQQQEDPWANQGGWGQQQQQQGGWQQSPQSQPPGWAQQQGQQPAQQPQQPPAGGGWAQPQNTPQQGGWAQPQGGNPNANPQGNPNAGPGGWGPSEGQPQF